MSGKYAFTTGLKELRFLFCQTSEPSAATRSFVIRAYPTMKKNNPHVPIMIREASGIEPRVFARYAYGKEKEQSLEGTASAFIEAKQICWANIYKGLSEKEIEDKITGLVKTE